MAALSIRDLDDDVRDRLRVRAAGNGRSMEAEVRTILTDAVSDAADGPGFLESLLQTFGELGGVELAIPPRTGTVRDVDFGP